MTARVARLLVYPVKSLDGQEVASAVVLPGGALEHDRAFALFDDAGGIVNAKRHAAIQRLRTSMDVAARSLRVDGTIYHVDADRSALERSIGDTLGLVVALAEDRRGGFPDDEAAPGPTLIGMSTLEAIADWFDLSVADVRARFRANVEIEGVPPFWEDRLFGAGAGTVPFVIGTVEFLGINPCLRCAVPTRDPWTGKSDRTFVQRFAALREAHLPPWAPADRFKPFYRLAVNTRGIGSGGVIAPGDRLVV